jgi:hypothetical protein
MNIKRWLSLTLLLLSALPSPVGAQGTPQSQTSTSTAQSTTTDGTQSNQRKPDGTQAKAPKATAKPHYYTNSSGQRVQSPTKAATVPPSATAQCRDGSYSFSQNHRGTCSHHGGVARWLK